MRRYISSVRLRHPYKPENNYGRETEKERDFGEPFTLHPSAQGHLEACRFEESPPQERRSDVPAGGNSVRQCPS